MERGDGALADGDLDDGRVLEVSCAGARGDRVGAAIEWTTGLADFDEDAVSVIAVGGTVTANAWFAMRCELLFLQRVEKEEREEVVDMTM